MLKRILSTLLLWSVLIGSLWLFGPHAAVGLLTIMSALTLHEFYGLTEKMGFKPFRVLGLLFGVLMTALPYYATIYLFDGEEQAGLAPGLLALATVALSLAALGAPEGRDRIGSLVTSILGLLYVPFMLHYLARLLLIYDDPSAGLALCIWVVAVAKFCDVGALLTGLAIGRHKMAPNISPKKTWEGALGGILVSAGIGAASAYFFAEYFPERLTPSVAALVAMLLAAMAIVSDLVESAMKRRADIKDTGTLIPGIGGAFDLTDSLILTAPVAYFVFYFLA